MEAILVIVITAILFYFLIKQGNAATSKQDNNISKYIVPNKNIPSEKDGVVRAICVNNYDGWLEQKHKNLKIGKQYTIEYAIIGSSTSRVYLRGVL